MKRIILPYILCIAFLTGCAQNQVNVNSFDNESHINVRNKNIYSWFKLENIYSYARKDGLNLFEVRLTNVSSIQKNIMYKVNWLDSNGFTINTILSKWIEVEVEGNDTLKIKGISPSAKAVEFQIDLKVPKNKKLQKNNNNYKNEG